MKSIKEKYSIELISHDMRREEMMTKIMETLEELQTISDYLFNKIEDKINLFNNRLENINCRTNECQLKINQIRVSVNKATKIFANYKYPNEEIGSNNDYKPINRYLVESKSDHFFITNDVKFTSSHIPFDEQLLKEKTQFFSVPKTGLKLNDNCFDFYDFNINSMSDPLGPIPWQRITSVSSLLVFNTADNAFLRRSQGSSIYDQKIRAKRPQQIYDLNSDIFQAPESILNVEQTEKRETLHYLPEVQSPPQIMDDLPQALPSLPGIADDIEFNISDEEFLSATIPNLNGIIGIIPQLPEIIGNDSTLLTNQSLNTQTKQEFSPSIRPSISATIAQSSESSPSPVPPPPPPPPPPPSPPPITTKETPIQPQKQINTQTVQTNSENSTQFIPTVDTNRASLLDSIRAAAGKPKKSTNIVIARKIEAKKNKQKEVVSGDLMSDLFNKLSMRRKGISGANVSSDSQTSAMERISAMIPPPPPVSNEDNDNNDDWE